MNERMPTSPDSIPHNYDLQINEGNLVTAESRVNHSYAEHPHPVGFGTLEYPVKTRGLGYREITLGGGQPFIVAERLKSGNQSNYNSDELETGTSEAGAENVEGEIGTSEPQSQDESSTRERELGNEEAETPPRHGVFVKYEADEDGMVQRALEYREPGDVIDWQHVQGPDRKVLLTDRQGNQYYVVGNHCYNLDESIKENKPVGWTRPDTDFNNVTIGENWQIDDDYNTGRIHEVQIKLETARDNGGEAAGEERGKDPFRGADELLARLSNTREARQSVEASNAGTADTLVHDVLLNSSPADEEPINDTSPIGKRERARRIMGRAASVLRGLPYLAKFKAENGVQRAREYFSDEEKGKRRKAVAVVAGVLIVGAAAYLELKNGGSSSQHHGHKAHHKHHRFPDAAHLKEGQNPWTEARHQLMLHGNAHPTNAEIEAYDKHMATLNPDVYSYSGDSSEHIPVGTELILPRIR